AAADYIGPVYISLTREPLPILYSGEFPFEIGKAVIIQDGSDVTIIANRDMVAHSLMAAASLEKQGISVRVIDCHTIKPIDEETILIAAKETKAIVTSEDNIKFGGLGSAVSELLVENYPIPMQRIAINDNFAESGPYLSLLEKYGLSSSHIEKAVIQVLERKNTIGIN
ncbi:MAG: transketolase family protein, partial [Anaerolineaceae bacterium]|nr:transketolase family protein [Anaerolineaceae bacterium]